MRRIAALSMLTFFAAVPAMAQDRPAPAFAGTSVTLIAGVDGTNRFSDWSAGAVYGAQVGHDWQTNRLVLGVEGEITGSSDRHCGRSLSTTGGVINACESTGRDIYVGGRVGTTVGEGTLLYGKLGYTNARQNFSGTQSRYADSDGFRLGGGVERRLTSDVTVKAEYRYSHYDAGGFDRHQAVMGIGFRF